MIEAGAPGTLGRFHATLQGRKVMTALGKIGKIGKSAAKGIIEAGALISPGPPYY
jgi:hypothetical protein